MQGRVVLAAVLLAVTLCACGGEPEPGAHEERIGPYKRSQFLLERDRFPSVRDPRTVEALEATWLKDDDEVFGVVVGERSARAYPIPMLAWHHVVNDVIAGIPVAVTY